MDRLSDRLSRLLSRVGIAARGATEPLRAAEEALARKQWLIARGHARTVLQRVPDSPHGLAVLADAAAEAGLDDELDDTLRKLAAHFPWRQDIWLRLGLVATRLGKDDAQHAFERAAHGDDAAMQRTALLAIADAEIRSGEYARALAWLARLPSRGDDAARSLRMAECLIARGEWDRARRHSGMDAEQEARSRLVRARLAARFPDEAWGGAPLSLAIGALLLGAPGAQQHLLQSIASSRDAPLVEQARQVVRDLELDGGAFAVAFALAEGRRDDALLLLERAARDGDDAVLATLIDWAIGAVDVDAMTAVCGHAPNRLPEDIAPIAPALGNAVDLDALCVPLSPRAGALADALMTRFVAEHLTGPRHWEALVRELSAQCRHLGRSDLAASVELLEVERRQPLRVAILGEFNAGKSTFINALLASDVAPTGVMPTTAHLHWVAWAPEPFARIVLDSGDRIVPHLDLKGALRELGDTSIRHVAIYAPIERLKRIELLDTPGFNAPNQAHTAQAELGIREAHVAIWLLDATAPLKDTERQVLESASDVPVQILINKCDRVDPTQRQQVLDYVSEALAGVAITSIGPPLMVSARDALAATITGTPDANSGWAAFETWLTDAIVDQSERWRERALVRRARAISDELVASAHEQARAAGEAQLRSDVERETILRLTHWLDALSDVSKLVARVTHPLQQLARDLRPALLSAEQAPSNQTTAQEADEPSGSGNELDRYRSERTVARLHGPLLEAMVELARTQEPDLVEAPLREALSPCLGSALATAACLVPHTDGAVLTKLIRGASSQASHQLAARASVAPRQTVAQRLAARTKLVATVIRGASGLG